MKNRYSKSSRISERKIQEIVRFFAADLTALQTAELSSLNRNTVNRLVDLGYGHFRVDHGKDEFVRRGVHINCIEGFWGMAKARLAKFKGLPKHTLHLHLKETEWRYNHRNDNGYRILLRYLREEPIS